MGRNSSWTCWDETNDKLQVGWCSTVDMPLNTEIDFMEFRNHEKPILSSHYVFMLVCEKLKPLIIICDSMTIVKQSPSDPVGIAIKNHPPVITIFYGWGSNFHRKIRLFMTLLYPNYTSTVAGLWFGFFFNLNGECHHPNWRTYIFFKGVGFNHQPKDVIAIYNDL